MKVNFVAEAEFKGGIAFSGPLDTVGGEAKQALDSQRRILCLKVSSVVAVCSSGTFAVSFPSVTSCPFM